MHDYHEQDNESAESVVTTESRKPNTFMFTSNIISILMITSKITCKTDKQRECLVREDHLRRHKHCVASIP